MTGTKKSGETGTPSNRETATMPSRGRCPICGRPTERTMKPFCSRRCADVDLARWLGGVYRVEIDDPDAEDEELATQIAPRDPEGRF